jgi:deoxyribodipyrimidine photo-lyase
LPSLGELGFEKTNLEDLDLPTGTSGGKNLLEKFYKNIKSYSTNRNFPSIRGVSYLSVHNRFGTLSIRHLAKLAIEADNDGALTWLSELIWRDFYFQIIANFPQVSEKKSFKSQFENLKFENDERKFEAWKMGQTGFPIIDAAMKQINQTGYMHNRLRMIVSSFLVKDLLIDWRWGEKYFEDNLIDFDFSANNGGWQWAASTGCDSQPYFRIFNPVLQSEKFDKDGSFIKKYIPQLAPLSVKEIHQPWVYFEKNKDAFPIKLGIDYPFPIVDHKEQRDMALSMYKACK